MPALDLCLLTLVIVGCLDLCNLVALDEHRTACSGAWRNINAGHTPACGHRQRVRGVLVNHSPLSFKLFRECVQGVQGEERSAGRTGCAAERASRCCALDADDGVMFDVEVDPAGGING